MHVTVSLSFVADTYPEIFSRLTSLGAYGAVNGVHISDPGVPLQAQSMDEPIKIVEPFPLIEPIQSSDDSSEVPPQSSDGPPQAPKASAKTKAKAKDKPVDKPVDKPAEPSGDPEAGLRALRVAAARVIEANAANRVKVQELVKAACGEGAAAPKLSTVPLDKVDGLLQALQALVPIN
jgi:hypothetical protein